MPDSIFFLSISVGDWALLLGGAGTLAGLIKGLYEYTQNNRMKRAEFLEKLITEFNDPKMLLAKRILDDFWIETEGEYEMSDEQRVRIGSEEKMESGVLDEAVKGLLRDHRKRSVTGNGEHKARQSFDDMLDFFTKLEYYLALKLITKQELHYFVFYLKRCTYKAEGAVLEFAESYGYESLFRLLYVLGLPPANTELLHKNLLFANNPQKRYYEKLKQTKK